MVMCDAALDEFWTEEKFDAVALVEAVWANDDDAALTLLDCYQDEPERARKLTMHLAALAGAFGRAYAADRSVPLLSVLDRAMYFLVDQENLERSSRCHASQR